MDEPSSFDKPSSLGKGSYRPTNSLVFWRKFVE